ncbi:MAG: Glu/Leu/Phe/Val dehydrogenase dimerization domain-containing protein [Nocardioides sp.]|uniref:Glu/Leu/Phe/Val dehydrogenase dimerization domain-containing protein n=1 Tax=Nocardioides sp. TaxID=35761 RepID=UPI003F04C1EC
MTDAAPTNLVFDRADELGGTVHEQVVFCRDRETGLRAVIALHDTRLGPALGGTRCYPYATEADAVRDVLRLSTGMTAKAAVAGLPLGGGKAVIIGEPAEVLTPDALRAYGRFVDTLAGRYYTAADVGTTAENLDVVATQTPYVVGSNSGSGDSGFSTALGVFSSMRAAAEHLWGSAGLAGRTVGVEGVGKVGTRLVELLLGAGAHVVAQDPSGRALARLLETHPDVAVGQRVLDADLDVYAPCALGGTLTPETVQQVRAALVCGAANNQLSEAAVAADLAARGVTWVPDYVANGGGLVQVAGEIWDRSAEQVRTDVEGIADTVTALLTRAEAGGRLPGEVADEIVAERLAAASAPSGTTSGSAPVSEPELVR